MSEPQAKRMRISEKKKPSFVYGNAPDKILLIEDSVFHVQSDMLIQHSEYFRVMFTSEFKEKDNKQIEIKGIEAEDAIMFMKAVYQLKKFKFEAEDLESLIKICVFFQSNEFLAKLYQEKPVSWIENLTATKILHVATEHGISELKQAVELSLIDNFSQKMKIKKKKVTRACDFTFDEAVGSSLKLTSEFELSKLKDVVDQYLTVEYQKSKHQYLVENQFGNLMGEYYLEQLKESMESHAITVFEKKTKDYESVLRTYSYFKRPIEMNRLKEKIEQFLLSEFKERSRSIVETRSYLKTSGHYKMNTLTKAIEDFLLAESMSKRGCVPELWNRIKLFYMLEEPNYDNLFTYRDFPKRNVKDAAVFHLSNLLEDVDKYGLNRIKEKLEDYLIAEFVKADQKRASSYMLISDLLHFTKYSSKYKDIIEQFSLKLFHSEKNKVNIKKYTQDLEECKEFKLETLYAAIQSHLLSEYKRKQDKEANMTDQDITQLAFRFKLEDITAYIQDVFISDFQENKNNSVKFGNLLVKYEMPLLKDSVTDFLSVSHINDPVIKAGREAIFSLPSDAQIKIFKCLFRE